MRLGRLLLRATVNHHISEEPVRFFLTVAGIERVLVLSPRT
jgi:hypothetical protein